MRRRDMITSTAALAGAAALGQVPGAPGASQPGGRAGGRALQPGGRPARPRWPGSARRSPQRAATSATPATTGCQRRSRRSSRPPRRPARTQSWGAGRGQRAARRRLHPGRRLRGQDQRRPAVLDDLRPGAAGRPGQRRPARHRRRPPGRRHRHAPGTSPGRADDLLSEPAATSSPAGTPARTSSPRTARSSPSPPTPPPRPETGTPPAST